MLRVCDYVYLVYSKNCRLAQYLLFYKRVPSLSQGRVLSREASVFESSTVQHGQPTCQVATVFKTSTAVVHYRLKLLSVNRESQFSFTKHRLLLQNANLIAILFTLHTTYIPACIFFSHLTLMYRYYVYYMSCATSSTRQIKGHYRYSVKYFTVNIFSDNENRPRPSKASRKNRPPLLVARHA